jgi:hypothetical protein
VGGKVDTYGTDLDGMGLTGEGRNGVTAVAPLSVHVESVCASGHLTTLRLDNASRETARRVISSATIAERCYCGARQWHHVQTRPAGIPTPFAGLPAQSDEDGPKTLRGAGVAPATDRTEAAHMAHGEGEPCPSCPPVEIID